MENKAMKSLYAARRTVGLSGQGFLASPSVIKRTIDELERNSIGREKLPETHKLLQAMLETNQLPGEKAAMRSMQEVNEMRDLVRVGSRPSPFAEVLPDGDDASTDEPDDSAPRQH